MDHLPKPLIKLDPNVCGELIHTAEVAGYAVEADAICTRITGPGLACEGGCVRLMEAHSSSHQCDEFPDWPWVQDSLFADSGWPESHGNIFRLKPQNTHGHGPSETHRRHIDELGRIDDVIGLSFDLAPQILCRIVYLRCGGHAPFSGKNLWMAEKLYPMIVTGAKQAFRQLPHPNSHTTEDLLANLSEMERQVLEKLCRCQIEREIAEVLGVSPHTIHVHVKSIYRKLMVSNHRQLLKLFDLKAQDKTDKPGWSGDNETWQE